MARCTADFSRERHDFEDDLRRVISGFASLPDGRSRAGICYHFASEQDTTDDYNGMVEVTCKNMKLVMLSAAEAEYATTFYAAEGAIALAEAAESIGHPQTTLRICTDNSVAVGIANSTMNIKRSRTINTSLDSRACTSRPVPSMLD